MLRCRHLPLARDLVRLSRQQLVHRLDSYMSKRNLPVFKARLSEEPLGCERASDQIMELRTLFCSGSSVLASKGFTRTFNLNPDPNPNPATPRRR